MKILLTFLIASAFFLFFPKESLAENLLKNGDFETGISPWEAGGGGVTAEISTDIRYDYTGEYALKIINDKISPYGYWQTLLNIEGGKNYRVTGFSASTDINIAYHYMQIAWYESIDASGSPISIIDSTKGENSEEWAEFDFVTQASGNARSAKIGIVLNSKTDGASTYTVFDNIAFEGYVAPTPTPTEAPQPTNTPAPIATSTPIPTQTPILISATLAPTPTIEPSPSEETLLGTDDLPTPTINNEQGQVLGSENTNDGKTNLPLIFIGLGLLLIFISLGTLLIPKLRMYNKTNEPKITELS